jgi:hypothetical protein
MKERFVLPREIQKQSEEFMNLMDTFAALKGQQNIDKTAKTKSAAVAKKIDGLCASLAAYYLSQATRWVERRKEISKQVR